MSSRIGVFDRPVFQQSAFRNETGQLRLQVATALT
jgi:hypothetical protein